MPKPAWCWTTRSEWGPDMANSKAIELMNAVNATLKKPVVTTAADPKYTTTYTPTGLLPTDILFHGGIPRGRFIELYGDYSTLKSYIGIMSIAEHQKRGMTAAVIDTEHSFDEGWAESCGVNTKDLIMSRPSSGEEAMDVCETLIRGGVNLIVFDSVAAMTPEAEQGKRLSGESVQPARIAMLMSLAMRRLTTANTDTSMIFINQLRTNIGITFGSSESLPGGKALPYYASYRASIRKVGKVTRDRKVWDGEKEVTVKQQIGQKFKIELTKSKLSKPFDEQWFTWSLLDGSLDTVGFLIAQGMELGLIIKPDKGSTWRTADNKLTAVGKDKFRKALEAHPDVVLDLENKVRSAHGLDPVSEATVHRHVTSKARPAKNLEPAPKSLSRGSQGRGNSKAPGLSRRLPRK